VDTGKLNTPAGLHLPMGNGHKPPDISPPPGVWYDGTKSPVGIPGML